MNFDFSTEQFMLRDTLRKFLAENAEAGRKDEAGPQAKRLWNGLVSLGLPSLLVPEEHGGMGMGFVDLVLLLEEFGGALTPGPIVETTLCSDVIARFGTLAQQAALLPHVATGDFKIVPAIFEAEAGYELAATKTVAKPSGSGWSLSGQKILVPYVEDADRLLVAASTGAGLNRLFLCDTKANGIAIRRHAAMDPSYALYEVSFDNVSLSKEDAVGAGSNEALLRLFDTGALAAAAQMSGINQRVLDMAVEYARLRVQFGQPIGAFQAIQHKCADMLMNAETSRSGVYYAAWTLTEDEAQSAQAVSIAKSFTGDACRMICAEGLQIHGGMGFTWDLGIHAFLRRGKYLEYAYGDAAWHRERVIAGLLTQREQLRAV